MATGSESDESDILCTGCKSGHSIPPNEIVICDTCNRGWHQRCHKPRIPDSIITDENQPWDCHLCQFALDEGIEKERESYESAGSSSSLPYDLERLTWDEHHQVNKENLYCYCGRSGQFHRKMLQCQKCLQWFHEFCITTLETPLLYGDAYYQFQCRICNNGRESVRKVIMKWSDVVALCLYNLSLQNGTRFFDGDKIVQFMRSCCDMVKLSEDIRKLSNEELASKINFVLTNNPDRFVESKEAKKKGGQWALRDARESQVFAPPNAGRGSLSPEKLPSPRISNGLKEELNSNNKRPARNLNDEFNAKPEPAKKSKLENKPKPSATVSTAASADQKSKTINLNSKGKISAIPKNLARRNSMTSVTSSSSKSSNATKASKPVAPVKRVRVRRRKPRSFYEQEQQVPRLFLDEVIPIPENFDGKNNPFFDELDPLKPKTKKAKLKASFKQMIHKIAAAKTERIVNSSDYIVKPIPDSPSKLKIQRVYSSSSDDLTSEGKFSPNGSCSSFSSGKALGKSKLDDNRNGFDMVTKRASIKSEFLTKYNEA